jgi:hypothetical protein
VRLLRLDCFFRDFSNDRTTAGTRAEVAQLRELIASGVKVDLIARKLKRSPGAIYSRISSFKKTPRELSFGAQRLSLPSERLAFAHASAQSSKIGDKRRSNSG